MNPPLESKGRDAFAEIDEIALSTAAVLKKIGESLDMRKEVNVSFNSIMTECLKVVTSLGERMSILEERVSALEDDYRLIVPGESNDSTSESPSRS